MLTQEENEKLTRVGPGTPCGELMRRYWHPITATAQLAENPVQKIKILGEELVLYRDRKGNLGLIRPRCPHRAMHLEFGVPEKEGLRCPYHGWLFNGEGRCLEQPLESPHSRFKDKIKIGAFPVQEMGGLVWGYLGPEPAPLLPRWDLFVREDGFRQILGHRISCNWLQVMENRGDLGHVVYLHGRLFQYALERQGRWTDDPSRRCNATMREYETRSKKGVYTRYRAIPNEFGFTKAALESDQSEESPFWRKGMNPILFPYILHSGHRERIRQVYQIGVPLDDTTTWHISYHCYVFPPGVGTPPQNMPPYVEVPLQNNDGEYILDYVLGQDMVAWYGQGDITDRTLEHLGASDACIIAYRKLLKEQIRRVAQGKEPMNVFRDPARNIRLAPPVPSLKELKGGHLDASQQYRANYHKGMNGDRAYIEDDVDRYCPDKALLLELYRKAEEAGQPDGKEMSGEERARREKNEGGTRCSLRK